MKMKVNLQKKKAITAAMLLTMCCYGQAWAEDINIVDDIKVTGNITKNIGTKNDNVTIKSRYISANTNAGINITGNQVKLTDVELFGSYNDISDYGSINVNANKVVLSSTDKDSLQFMNVTTKVNINQNSDYKTSTVQIDRPIFVGRIDNSGYLGNLKINFYGEDSYFHGYIVQWATSYASLTFDKKAKWVMPNYESNGGMINDTGSAIDDLKLLNGSVIDFNSKNGGDDFKSLGIENNFDGSGGIIKMNFDGSKKSDMTFNGLYTSNWQNNYGDFIIVEGGHNGNTSLILSNTSKDNSNVIGRVIAFVKNEQGTFNVTKAEGTLSWTKYDLEGKEVDYTHQKWSATGPIEVTEKWTDWTITGFSHETAPTTSTKTLLSTITAGYDTWRNDTDKFNERMGELRMNGAGSDGVWVRTKGSEFGRHSSNGSYTNKQQTYQLGYDTVTSKDEKKTTYTGVAAEYGKGSLTFDSGTGTMKSMGLGVYQSQLRESGHYLDLTYRFDKYKNDFHVADSMGNPISGKYGNNAMSLSAEYGRKNSLKHGWYVEPQSEVTLGYMFGNDFTTSNNIRVEQKNMPALIGRLGLNIGREVSDKVNFYVKASVNHDFLGNYDMHMTDMSTGERLNASDKFGSSWFDYGAGLSVKTGKDSYAYFDIERAVGGEYKKNWDWNAGVRWSF